MATNAMARAYSSRLLDVVPGLVQAGSYPRRRRRRFLDYIHDVAAQYPHTELHVILDIRNKRNSQPGRWRQRHPRVRFHFIPACLPWLNMVQGGWRMDKPGGAVEKEARRTVPACSPQLPRGERDPLEMVGIVGESVQGWPGHTEGGSLKHWGQNVESEKKRFPKWIEIRSREWRIPGETEFPAVNQRMEFWYELLLCPEGKTE